MLNPTYKHKLGKKAEKTAMLYLNRKGYVAKEKNYRFKKAEIDLIVQKENLLVFVEIKARKHDHFGHPESFMNNQQKRRYQLAADEYIQQKAWCGQVRFDIIACKHIAKKPTLQHFQDAFY